MVNLIDIEAKDSKNTLPDPMMAILFFFIVTSIYCVITLFITDSTQRFIAKVCYILFVITGEYFINLNLSESMCGVRQWQSSFFITIIPWMLIFVVMHLFITLFPGWLSPFSNTFGYLVAKLMGLPDLMKILLVEDTTESVASRALESVRTDASLLINELYTEHAVDRPNFKKAWDKLVQGKIIQDNYNSKLPEGKTMMDRLYNFVQMKFTIAEYIWNLLTGFLVTSISYNYIINTGCAKSPKEMKERYDKYEEEEDKRQREKEQKDENQPTYIQS
jgi:hypothetical protein